MKKIYNAPEAGLLCFAPVETLATELKEISFGSLIDLGNGTNNPGQYKGASDNAGDIKINI